jgi:hypothetical protein
MAETPKLAASLAASFCSAALRNHFKAAAGGLPFPHLRAFPVETGRLLAPFFFSGRAMIVARRKVTWSR